MKTRSSPDAGGAMPPLPAERARGARQAAHSGPAARAAVWSAVRPRVPRPDAPAEADAARAERRAACDEHGGASPLPVSSAPTGPRPGASPPPPPRAIEILGAVARAGVELGRISRGRVVAAALPPAVRPTPCCCSVDLQSSDGATWREQVQPRRFPLRSRLLRRPRALPRLHHRRTRRVRRALGGTCAGVSKCASRRFGDLD